MKFKLNEIVVRNRDGKTIRAHSRIRIGYYHRLGERHVQCQKDQINMPGRFSPANRRLPSESGRSPSERMLVAQRERSSSEQWTFVQRVHARDPKVDARLARERTLAQLGHSSSELWTFVQRGQKVDARPAINGRSPSDGRSPSEQAEMKKSGGRRPEDAAELVLGASKVENHQFPPSNPCFIASMMYICS
ncbi:hypothetical protein LR48_Vigan08g118000 [Vigna angularis]|uniref:Uncharacterized protein n=1 Tax=Phaseolus angularis TaxID=3914 RepID=A0A0L9V5T7_PHAAN|nr:hypothetical protein LR48_Vigan08g118000 [Vigna angularis]